MFDDTHLISSLFFERTLPKLGRTDELLVFVFVFLFEFSGGQDPKAKSGCIFECTHVRDINIYTAVTHCTHGRVLGQSRTVTCALARY